MKRAYLKRFSSNNVKTSGRVQYHKIAHAKERTGADPDTWAKIDSSEFMQAVPPVQHARTAVNRLRKQWQSELRGQGFDNFDYYIKMPATEGAANRLMMSGSKYIIVREYPTKLFTSVIYTSREKAWEAFMFSTIKWNLVQDLEEDKVDPG